MNNKAEALTHEIFQLVDKAERTHDADDTCYMTAEDILKRCAEVVKEAVKDQQDYEDEKWNDAINAALDAIDLTFGVSDD